MLYLEKSASRNRHDDMWGSHHSLCTTPEKCTVNRSCPPALFTVSNHTHTQPQFKSTSSLLLGPGWEKGERRERGRNPNLTLQNPERHRPTPATTGRKQCLSSQLQTQTGSGLLLKKEPFLQNTPQVKTVSKFCQVAYYTYSQKSAILLSSTQFRSSRSLDGYL